ncbi:hypothetical protein PBI_TOAKA_62 [Mycobacterium phage Toaka]|nr:hypothetical protein PBI_TOAKA_62 [Mycobacterium phage Toaka]
MSKRECVHVVEHSPVTDVRPGWAVPMSTIDLRVFYPLSEGGFSGAVTELDQAYYKARDELRKRYEEFTSE